MKRFNFISIFFVAILILMSCSDDDMENSQIQIRLSNISPFDYKNITIDTSTGIINFDDLDAGSTSEYKIFERAYRYAFVELEIQGNTYTIQPIDYVGETLLNSGKYTYEIDANSSQEQYGKLTLTFVED